jgi:cellulose synthase/poly-beta-1,6-N-acetylglucosamine synthase-like glycosyltransferase
VLRTVIQVLYLVVGLLSAVPVAYLLLNTYLARTRRLPGARTTVPLTEITVVVPVHDQKVDVFRESLASVSRQGCRVVVVGDASLEPYRSIVESQGGTFVYLAEHVGKKGALAAGLAEVRTPYVLFVDSDTVLPENAARDLASWFMPDVGGVGANLTVKDTGHGVAYCAEFVERAREVVLRAMSSRGSVLYLDGACSMFRTEVIRPFVESAEFQDLRVLGRPSQLGDDWLLTDYLLREGLTTAKAYDVKVTTYPKETYAEFVRQNVRWSRSNWIRLGRFLGGRGPKHRGAFFTFEVVGTYALPLIALATLLARIPVLIHVLDRAPPSLEGEGILLLHALLGLSHTMTLAVVRISLTLVGAFATGAYLVTVLRGSQHPTLRMIGYGALGTAILFATALFGLFTVWKRPSWSEARPTPPVEAPTAGSPRIDLGWQR